MVKVAVGQVTSTSSKLHNFEVKLHTAVCSHRYFSCNKASHVCSFSLSLPQVCARLVKEAVEAGASLLALPECFSFIGVWHARSFETSSECVQRTTTEI